MSEFINLTKEDLAIKRMFIESVDTLMRTTNCSKEAAQEASLIMVSRLMSMFRKDTIRKYLLQIGCFE